MFVLYKCIVKIFFYVYDEYYNWNDKNIKIEKKDL